MKFMLTTRSRIGVTIARPEKPMATFQAANQWSREKLEDGTFDCVYGFLDGRGGVTIANADSHEEILQLVRSSPMYHYMDYEIHPLCDLQLLWEQQTEAARIHHGK